MGITIKELAGKIGMSICAVSLVLNGKADGRISPARQKMIRDLARENNYRPNLFGKALRTEKHGSIGVAMPEPVNPYYSRMILAVQKSLQSHGYMPLFSFWHADDEIDEVMERIFSQNVDGIISWYAHASLETEGIPYVVWGDSSGKNSTVTVDVEFSVRNSIDYLKKLGHTKIAYLGVAEGPRCDFTDGYAKKRKLGLTKILIPRISEKRTIMETALNFFRSPEAKGITAVIAHNDNVAFCLYHALAKAGLRIPEDVSVIGFDNTDDSPLMLPPLTTYGINPDIASERLVGMLMNTLEFPEQRKVMIRKLVPDFIVRESCMEPGRFPCSRNNSGRNKEEMTV